MTEDFPSTWVRPPATRSRLVLEMAYELVGHNQWPYSQALVHMRTQGAGEEWPLALFGSDSPVEIWRVARREVQLAIVNPAEPLALAARGVAPFTEPLPLRMITVLPNEDAFALAVSDRTGLTSLEQVRDQRYPLRISVRQQRTHGTHLFSNAVLGGWVTNAQHPYMLCVHPRPKPKMLYADRPVTHPPRGAGLLARRRRVLGRPGLLRRGAAGRGG